MDSQFNTLIRSFHDNFLQYKLTGTASYKKAYEGAQEGIENILNSLESSVQKDKSQIKDFYSSGSEDKLRDAHSKKTQLQNQLVDQNDKLSASQLRTQASPSTPSQPLFPQYVALAVLGTTAVALLMI
jgi:hypothetical protein